MKRKGVSGFLVTGIVFFLFIMQFMLAASYLSMVMEQAESQVAEGFRRASTAEKLLDAPCATKSRGVFYASALEAGDLRCVWPQNTLYVRFESTGLVNSVNRPETDENVSLDYANNQTVWRLEREAFDPLAQDYRIFVMQLRRMPAVDDIYEISVYNRTTGETYPGRMGVSAQWPAGAVS